MKKIGCRVIDDIYNHILLQNPKTLYECILCSDFRKIVYFKKFVTRNKYLKSWTVLKSFCMFTYSCKKQGIFIFVIIHYGS